MDKKKDPKSTVEIRKDAGKQEVSTLGRSHMKGWKRCAVKLLILIVMLLVLFHSNGAVASDDKAAAEAAVNYYRQYFRSDVDKIEGIKWIFSKKTPKEPQLNDIHSYLGESDEGTWARVRIGIVVPVTVGMGITMRDILFNIDGVKYAPKLSVRDGSVHHVAAGANVLKYLDIKATSELEEIMWKIANGKEVMIRCKGKTHNHDFEVSQEQKEALEYIWGYFKAKRVLGETLH